MANDKSFRDDIRFLLELRERPIYRNCDLELLLDRCVCAELMRIERALSAPVEAEKAAEPVIEAAA